jgi:hypothetical protein
MRRQLENLHLLWENSSPDSNKPFDGRGLEGLRYAHDLDGRGIGPVASRSAAAAVACNQ